LAFQSFEDLEVWKKSCRLAVQVYESLRETRDFGLKDQMTRSSVSIASNIAEGVERGSRADCSRFIHIAKGSAAELRTQLYIAQRAGVLEGQVADGLVRECQEISAMLQSFAKHLKSNPLNTEH
jgi:four helix bundle protein